MMKTALFPSQTGFGGHALGGFRNPGPAPHNPVKNVQPSAAPATAQGIAGAAAEQQQQQMPALLQSPKVAAAWNDYVRGRVNDAGDAMSPARSIPPASRTVATKAAAMPSTSLSQGMASPAPKLPPVPKAPTPGVVKTADGLMGLKGTASTETKPVHLDATAPGGGRDESGKEPMKPEPAAPGWRRYGKTATAPAAVTGMNPAMAAGIPGPALTGMNGGSGMKQPIAGQTAAAFAKSNTKTAGGMPMQGNAPPASPSDLSAQAAAAQQPQGGMQLPPGGDPTQQQPQDPSAMPAGDPGSDGTPIDPATGQPVPGTVPVQMPPPAPTPIDPSVQAAMGSLLQDKTDGDVNGDDAASTYGRIVSAAAKNMKSLKSGFWKSGGQTADSKRFSATGESKGLSVKTKADDYAKGDDAWNGIAKYLHHDPKCDDPRVKKTASLQSLVQRLTSSPAVQNALSTVAGNSAVYGATGAGTRFGNTASAGLQGVSRYGPAAALTLAAGIPATILAHDYLRRPEKEEKPAARSLIGSPAGPRKRTGARLLLKNPGSYNINLDGASNEVN